ncbi:hypothetical protein CO230_05495 [Chryseobacterium sp. 6424]|nr:hypothetical protein CO230_05495 [Chryseobacterium sp. 6424]
MATNVAAQVGINTETPGATLDVNGNLIIRQVDPATAASNYNFLVVNSTTAEVEQISGSNTPPAVNTTIARLDEENNLSLLNVSGFNGWRRIDFATADINVSNNFDLTDDVYVVPSSGIYAVNYEFRYGDGVILQVLNIGGAPSIGILRQTGAGYTVLDQKTFSGANIPLVASILISQSTINSVYRLTAGDRLSFEVLEGGLALSLLSDSRATVSIYKISD